MTMDGLPADRSCRRRAEELISLQRALKLSSTSEPTEIERFVVQTGEFLTELISSAVEKAESDHRPIDTDRCVQERPGRKLDQEAATLAQKDSRYHEIAEANGAWIWDTDSRHRFIDVGSSIAVIGIGSEIVYGKTPWEVFGCDPASYPNWEQHKKELDAHVPFRNFPHSLMLPSGAELHLSSSGRPVFDHGGAFRGYRGITTNTSATADAFRRAEQAEAMLRDAIGSLSGGIIICDAQDRIVL
jgi:PAS domain-containing protein